jgi:hypothetical protein
MSSGRIERCFTDNIYLIESLPEDEDNPYERSYIIMGNSGRTYTVTISHRPKCTCPDFRTRANRCKHIFFVLIRIMNVSNFQDKTYSEEELEEMFENIPQVAKNLIYQGKLPSQQEEVNQKFDKDDICPICLDPLENGKELDYCKYSCGKTIHKKCFSMWEKSKGGICVFCRGQWYSDYPIKNPKKVSMHPIDSIQIDEENENSGNITNTNEENIEDKCEKIDIDEEQDNEEDINIEVKKKKNKKRYPKSNRKKSKSRSKDREKSMSISDDRSRSRSRNRNRSKSRNKIRYPKK